jgi:hypothetical protein
MGARRIQMALTAGFEPRQVAATLLHRSLWSLDVAGVGQVVRSRTSAISFNELAQLITELIRVTDEFRDAQAFVEKVRLARADTADAGGRS